MEGACRRCNLCSVALSFLAQLYSTAAGIAVLGATYVLLCNCKGLQREILLLCIALLVRVEMIKYSNSCNGATPSFSREYARQREPAVKTPVGAVAKNIQNWFYARRCSICMVALSNYGKKRRCIIAGITVPYLKTIFFITKLFFSSHR